MSDLCDIGLIGLAVMGENLALNIESRGYRIAVFNRTTEKVDDLINGRAKGKQFVGCHTIAELVKALAKPRKVMLMVKAGPAVDSLIEQLLPLLDKGDIIIDGGNTYYADTERRTKYVESKGLLYIGTGVSGGEEGARHGPSIMPGGSPAAWPHVKEIFQAIAAKVDDGAPCCDWVGEQGAGHYVKMVHNGIEYGDMQLICEAYNIMKNGLGMSADEMHQVFTEWNQGDLDSYLIEISRDILAKKDDDGEPLVDKILDTAGQKGTGKWTVINSADLGMPITLIAEAVYSRCVSALKDERVKAARKLKGPNPKLSVAKNAEKKKAFINDIRDALYASKIVSYAQGYMLMRAAAAEYKWKLNYGGIALMWRGGCIIRSRFLGKIKAAYDNNPKLANLMLDNYFRGEIKRCQKGWRNVVANAAKKGIPVPAFGTALAFYDQYRSGVLPANLLQAQRDYFGAHTYERVDKPRGEYFHTNWTGRGGTTSSSSYNA
jgi:6-phosphogluconate dehydrogenase